MPAQLVFTEPRNGGFYARRYGWAVVTDMGDQGQSFLVFDDETCPEMCPGEHRYRAAMHAQQLITDGGVWPDQVTLWHFVGNHGTFRLDHKVIAEIVAEYEGERAEPSYWERVSAAC